MMSALKFKRKINRIIKIIFKTSASNYIRNIQFYYFLFLRRTSQRERGLVIVGCGRSGTTYTSKKMKSLGIDIGHERLKKDGISSWYLVSDQFKVPLGPNFEQIKKLTLPIVHQVREPLQCISSMLAIGRISYEFLSNEIPIDFENDSKILRAMKYWYYWNLKAESKAIFTYQIEEFSQILDELLEIGQFSLSTEKFKTDVNTNSRKHIDLAWSDLNKEDENLCHKIKELGRKYGYII
jgi:hypothetical protein